ncbi:unnamed protein product [Boreogadus saida]
MPLPDCEHSDAEYRQRVSNHQTQIKTYCDKRGERERLLSNLDTCDQRTQATEAAVILQSRPMAGTSQPCMPKNHA